METRTKREAGALLSPSSLGSCELCPRRCRADRLAGARGICGADGTLRLARAALHFWEEPPISGEAGSGTIFFSGCPLKCVYCQNHEISTGNFGIEVPPERLVEIMLELQDQGALNINLVTATHYAHLLPQALDDARRRGLSIPIVYNTSGYERVEAVRELGDLVDIWLTDFKYGDAALGRALSHVPDYPEVAESTLVEMSRQLARRGGPASRPDGTWTRGIIVRHLVLPGHVDDSCRVLDRIWNAVGDVPISVMNQYTPNARMRTQGGELARAITDEEYEQVLDHADDLGFTQMFWQEGGAVDESFTPPFDTTGVLVRADACSNAAGVREGGLQ
ncbi:radical SAM protein [Collinsella sp. An2]|uniref:radical SAM protein n=1 Tax=Collinsella sp. An2 TaxID=1965585 RepID=UPI000B3A209F|nr:radical SAM protein [Collinsella sp. An2]OUP08448.1 radical SAM protein [Collinsella sp. An2]